MRKGKKFKIKLEQQYFEKGDTLLTGPTNRTLLVTSNPRRNWWNRIKKFFGFKYSSSYTVKIIKDE